MSGMWRHTFDERWVCQFFHHREIARIGERVEAVWVEHVSGDAVEGETMEQELYGHEPSITDLWQQIMHVHRRRHCVLHFRRICPRRRQRVLARQRSLPGA